MSSASSSSSDEDTPSLSSLPPELLLSILRHLPSSSLLSASLVSTSLSPFAQHTLFRSPHIRSLSQLDLLLVTLQEGQLRPRPIGDDDEDEQQRSFAVKLRELRVTCREWGSKGWGPRLGKMLRLCTRLRYLTLDGVPDLRIKHLVGCGALRELTLLSSTFRSHSLPTSPHLHSTLSSLSTLSLTNLGLPPDSSHFSHLLLACSPTLLSLSLSYLRDVRPSIFLSGLSSLLHLQSLSLGVLTTDQRHALSEALQNLPSLQTIDFEATLPTADHLVALPPSVTVVRFGVRPNDRGSEEVVDAVCEAFGRGAGKGWRKIEMWREELANRGIERAAGAARMRRGESVEEVRIRVVDGFRVEVFV